MAAHVNDFVFKPAGSKDDTERAIIYLLFKGYGVETIVDIYNGVGPIAVPELKAWAKTESELRALMVSMGAKMETGEFWKKPSGQQFDDVFKSLTRLAFTEGEYFNDVESVQRIFEKIVWTPAYWRVGPEYWANTLKYWLESVDAQKGIFMTPEQTREVKKYIQAYVKECWKADKEPFATAVEYSEIVLYKFPLIIPGQLQATVEQAYDELVYAFYHAFVDWFVDPLRLKKYRDALLPWARDYGGCGNIKPMKIIKEICGREWAVMPDDKKMYRVAPTSPENYHIMPADQRNEFFGAKGWPNHVIKQTYPRYRLPVIKPNVALSIYKPAHDYVSRYRPGHVRWENEGVFTSDFNVSPATYIRTRRYFEHKPPIPITVETEGYRRILNGRRLGNFSYETRTRATFRLPFAAASMKSPMTKGVVVSSQVRHSMRPPVAMGLIKGGTAHVPRIRQYYIPPAALGVLFAMSDHISHERKSYAHLPERLTGNRNYKPYIHASQHFMTDADNSKNALLKDRETFAEVAKDKYVLYSRFNNPSRAEVVENFRGATTFMGAEYGAAGNGRLNSKNVFNLLGNYPHKYGDILKAAFASVQYPQTENIPKPPCGVIGVDPATRKFWHRSYIDEDNIYKYLRAVNSASKKFALTDVTIQEMEGAAPDVVVEYKRYDASPGTGNVFKRVGKELSRFGSRLAAEFKRTLKKITENLGKFLGVLLMGAILAIVAIVGAALIVAALAVVYFAVATIAGIIIFAFKAIKWAICLGWKFLAAAIPALATTLVSVGGLFLSLPSILQNKLLGELLGDKPAPPPEPWEPPAGIGAKSVDGGLNPVIMLGLLGAAGAAAFLLT